MGQVRCQLADRHRLGVRLIAKLAVRQAFEHLPGVVHFVVEFGQ